MIIKPDDVPELSLLEYRIFAIPKSDSFHIAGRCEAYFMDTLPVDSRNVGEYSNWIRKPKESERGSLQMTVTLYKFDSREGIDRLKNSIEGMKKTSPENWEYGTCSIGEYCIYYSEPPSTNYHTTLIFFTTDYEYVEISITDEKDKRIDEAIRIAEIIEGRL